jgi:hypothetical protein
VNAALCFKRRNWVALVKCKECGEEVSTKAKACPKCGAWLPKKTSIVTWGVLALILFAIYNGWLPEFNLTPEKRNAKEEKLAITVAKEEEKENHRKGFHCLSSWKGSHSAVEKYVEERMRDPDSFEHVETRISPVNDKGTHQLFMTYRATNGFGGLTVGSATATVDNESCRATITSME